MLLRPATTAAWCIQSCPVKAIKTVDNRPFWTFNCESCMHCMSYCPKRAIETAHGSIVLITVLSSLVFSGLLCRYFGQLFFDIERTFAGFILESVLFLGILAVWYRLLHYAMRFKFVERLVVYTSLTKYKFWGRRYPGLKKDVIRQPIAARRNQNTPRLLVFIC